MSEPNSPPPRASVVAARNVWELALALSGLASPELVRSVRTLAAELVQASSSSRAADDEVPLSTLSDSELNGVVAQGAQLPAGDQKAITRQLLSTAETDAAAIRLERMRQARIAFNLALVFSAVGLALLVVTVILVTRHHGSVAALTTAIAGINQLIAVGLFRVSREANDRLDAVARDIGVVKRLGLALSLIDSIDDPTSRDAVIGSAVRSISADIDRDHGSPGV